MPIPPFYCRSHLALRRTQTFIHNTDFYEKHYMVAAETGPAICVETEDISALMLPPLGHTQFYLCYFNRKSIGD